MLAVADVIGPWAKDVPEGAYWNIKQQLVPTVNALAALMAKDGVYLRHNPKTKTEVSGELYGGFRPASCTIGAKNSAHKTGQAVDLYDPDGALDAWCMNNQDKLVQLGLWLEHPSATPGWCHVTTRQLGARNHVFFP